MEVPIQRKKYSPLHEGELALVVTHRKPYRKSKNTIVSGRYLVKCGDCGERIEIFYGDGALEIGGVYGSIQNWREILLPLLEIEGKDGEYIDVSEKLVNARKKLEELRKIHIPLS